MKPGEHKTTITGVLTWPAYLHEWTYLRVVEFPDEPKVWWWTDTHMLLRGVGKKPDGYDFGKPKKEFAETAALQVRRTKTDWQRCSSKSSHISECVRSLKNDHHGIDVKYYRLLEHWPKPVKWLVPENKLVWNVAALAVEVQSQQIVAVVMPVAGTEGWDLI